jgi:hypothetical protein
MYAFVLWFTPISNPIPHIKLRTIEKLKGARGRIGGIIPLDSIKMPCALAPAIDETFFDELDRRDNTQITQDNCMIHFDKFFINCFAGHVDYEVLR